MLNKKVVKAKQGAAIISKDTIIAIAGSWTADELLHLLEEVKKQ